MVMMQGYQMNLKIFTNVDSAIVDPKSFSNDGFVTRKTDVCVIPPNSFALAKLWNILKYKEMS